MRSLVITTGSSSSIVTQKCHNHHNLFLPKQSLSLSLLKPTSPLPPSSSSNPPSSTLLTSPNFYPPNTNNNNNDLIHYASNLIADGKFDEFKMVVNSLVTDSGSAEFGDMLDSKLVLSGIVKVIKEGRIKDVIGLFSCFSEMGFDILRILDGSCIELLKSECQRIVNQGHLDEAVEIMETLAGFQFSVKDLVKPSDMVRVFVSTRSPSLSVRYACLIPNSEILFCTIIREFGKRADLRSAMKVFEVCKQKMSGHNMYVYRSIIDVCGICGDCFKSRLIYEDLLVENVTPNIFVFNSLMNVNAHDLTYTMEVYQQMQSSGIEADMTSYNILLKACCLSERIDLAQDIYGEVQRLESTGRLKLDVFTYSTIIKVFADAKLWQMAVKIKEDMVSAGVTPNTVTWSSLISACAKAGLVERATQLFEEMLMAGCEPNSQCFNTLLHACVEACQFDRAFRLFDTWKSSGSLETSTQDHKDIDMSVHPTEEYTRSSVMHPATTSCHLNFARRIPFEPTTTTYNILLKACGTDVYRAKSLMDEMKTLGLSPNHISWSILIDICGKAGNVAGSLQILFSMSESGVKPDVVAYTTAIKVCVESKNLTKAFSLFMDMKRYRIKPNLVTYNTLLKARSRYGSLQEVQQCLAVYQDMRRAGYKSNDYYLKLLIEEWCEGVIQKNNQEGQSNLRNRADIGGLRSLLLERVATHLQKNRSESLGVDIQGLTKVEARLVVLAALRMLKEYHNSGRPIKDDLIVILGMTKVASECAVKDAITKLLKKELGLEVISIKPGFMVDRQNDSEATCETISDAGGVLGTVELSAFLDTPRRPAFLQRLLVTKKSLNNWLLRRSDAGSSLVADSM